MAYSKTFPYTLRYKGSSYVIDKDITGSGTFTTIQKDGGAIISFDDIVDFTPAYIELTEATTGIVGDPIASATIDLDTIADNLFILHETEVDWGKQSLQNILHLMERIELIRINALVENQEMFWMMHN